MPVTSDFVRALVAAAITAPSGGNNQPWKFYVDREDLFVVNDRRRATAPTLDVHERATYAALGAAVEAIVIAAARLGRRAEVTWLPRPATPVLAARVRFSDAPREALADDAALFDLLERRGTNRRLGARREIPSADVQAMRDAVSIRGGRLHLVMSEPELSRVAEIVGIVDGLRLFDAAMRAEMAGEIRFSQADVTRTRDGIDIATLEIGKGEQWMIRKLLQSANVARVLERIGFSRGLVAGAKKTIARSSAFGIITVPGHSLEDFLQGGRAMLRAWLVATRAGLAFQPLAAATYLFTRVRAFGGEGLPPSLSSKLRDLYGSFSRSVPALGADEGHVLYFRLGYADPASTRALRRPVEDVLFVGPPDV